MNFKRIFTAIISLMLVCCLLVNVSPIKADALPLDPIFLGWTLSETVYYAIALGIGIGVGCNVLEAAAEGADIIEKWVATNLDEGEIAELYNEDGLIKILQTNDPDLPYMVSADLVEAVRNWAFDNEVITETSITVPSGCWLYNGYAHPPIPSEYAEIYPVHFLVKNNADSGYLYCVTKAICATSSPNIQYYGPGVRFYVSFNDSSEIDDPYLLDYSYSTSISREMLWSNIDWYDNAGNLFISGSEPIEKSSTTVAVVDGYDQYYIAPSSSSLAEGYELWHQKAYEYTNEDGSIDLYYPIALGESLEDTMLFSQEDVWSGAIAGGAVVDPDNPSSTNPDVDIGDDSSNLANILSILSTISNYQQTGNIQMQTEIKGLSDTLGVTNGILSDSKGLLESILASNAFGFENVVDSIISLPGSIGEELDDIENSIGTLGGLVGGIGINTDTMKETLAAVLAGVTAIPAELVEPVALAVSQVFIPTEGYVDNKVSELTTNYEFADSIAKTGKDLKEFLLDLGSKPPVIRINLSESTGKLNWGKDMVLVDFSFYEPYKPTMDAILSAFLWLWFCWRVVLALPGIISGAAGVVGNRIDTSSAGANAFDYVAGALKNTPSDVGKTQRDFTPHPSGTAAYEKWRSKQK